MKLRRLSDKKLIEVVIWIFLVGAIGFATPATRDVFIFLTPFNLLFSILVLLYAINSDMRKRHWVGFFFVYSIGFVVELIGVNTGWPFGNYAYGAVLGIKFFETPLLIGINWLILVLATHLFLTKFIAMRFLIPFIGASAMLVFDFVMEPVAIATNMWTWSGVIPWENFVAWWFVALILHFILLPLHFRRGAKVGLAIFLAQFVFFIVLNIFYNVGL